MATVLSVLQPIHPVPGIGGLKLAGVVTQSVSETSGFPPLPSPVPLDPPDPPITLNVAAGGSPPLPSPIDSDGAATHTAEISSIPPTVAGATFSGSQVDPAPHQLRGDPMEDANLPLSTPTDADVVRFLDSLDSGTFVGQSTTAASCGGHRVFSILLSPSRMMLTGQLGAKTIRVLVDTGATLSAISSEWLTRNPTVCADMVESAVNVPVELADSRTVQVSRAIRDAPVCLGPSDEHRSVDLHVMPLPTRCDVLLGTDFLMRHHAHTSFSDGAAALGFASGCAPVPAKSFSRGASAVGSSLSFLSVVGDGEFDTTSVDVVTAAEARSLVTDDTPMMMIIRPDASAATPTPNPEQHRVDRLVERHPTVFAEPRGVPERPGNVDMAVPLKPDAVLPSPRSFGVPKRQQHVLHSWVEQAIDRGWIEKCSSAVNSPLFAVPKPHGRGWRIVLDLRAVNLISASFHQASIAPPMRLCEEVADALVLSASDLADGFHQLKLREADRYLTAFTVQGVQYQYCVAPMGLKNVPLVFQTMVNNVLRKHGLLGAVQLGAVRSYLPTKLRAVLTSVPDHVRVGTGVVYIDDLLLGTNGIYDEVDADVRAALMRLYSSEHPVALERRRASELQCAHDIHEAMWSLVLAAFETDRIHIKLAKCDFFRSTVTFLGYLVGEGQLRSDPRKVEAVTQWLPPSSVKEVRMFLGFVGFLRLSIPAFSELASPLHMLTRKNAKFVWSTACQFGFDSLKAAVSSSPVLQMARWDRPFTVVTDCSQTAAGGCLMQEHDGKLLPVAYWSQTLTEAEQRYPAQHLEAFAIHKAVQHWKYYLWGAKFSVRLLTDHRSLTHWRTQRDSTGRLGRWQEALSEFEFEIQYLPGRENFLADCLSRHPASPTMGPILRHLRSVDVTGLEVTRLPAALQGFEPLDAVLRRVPADRVVILTRSQRAALDVLPAAPVQPPTALFQEPRAGQQPPTVPAIAPTPFTSSPAELAEANSPLPRVIQDPSFEFLDRLDYSEDKDFGPVYDLLVLLRDDPEWHALYRASPTQLPVKRLPKRLRKAAARIQYYQLIGNRVYNLSQEGYALVLPDVQVTVGGADMSVRRHIVSLYHDDQLGGHRSARPTHLRVRRSFYFHNMATYVRRYVDTCDACNRSKSRTAAPLGLLESPGLPLGPNDTISIDFIMDLQPDPVTGHDGVLVCVDRFTKRLRLLPVSSRITGRQTAELLERQWFMQYGYPRVIISDRDPRFTAHYYRELMALLGVELAMSSGNHPQTDGATERRIRVLEECLRCYIDYAQATLFILLPFVEFALNDAPDPASGMSAFCATYGYNPMRPADLAAAVRQGSSVQSVTEHFETVHSVRMQCRDGLRQAQAAYVYEANQHRRAVPLSLFKPGDLVYVARANFVPPAMRKQPTRKLQPRYFGPYPVVTQVSPTSYKVRLPGNVRTHPVFHASQLKPLTSNAQFPDRRGPRIDPVLIDTAGDVHWAVETLLDTRLYRSHRQFLVKWKGYPVSEATWQRRDVLVADLGRDYVDDMLQQLQQQ